MLFYYALVKCMLSGKSKQKRQNPHKILIHGDVHKDKWQWPICGCQKKCTALKHIMSTSIKSEDFSMELCKGSVFSIILDLRLLALVHGLPFCQINVKKQISKVEYIQIYTQKGEIRLTTFITKCPYKALFSFGLKSTESDMTLAVFYFLPVVLKCI